MALLEVRDLVKSYGRRRVVDGVSLDIEAGEVVGLLGPNGAGKTTTFRMTAGLLKPERGTVRFKGQDVTRWPMFRRSRLGMGFLPQDPSVFQGLSVEDNLIAILEWHMPDAKARREKARAMLEEFGLARLAGQQADRLSGGETRRLEIARSLLTEPTLILLDEPFAGLDPITVAEIQGYVRRLRERGLAVLMTDHNVRETLAITDRSYIIDKGKVLAEGPPDAILRNDVVREVYLGKGFKA